MATRVTTEVRATREAGMVLLWVRRKGRGRDRTLGRAAFARADKRSRTEFLEKVLGVQVADIIRPEETS